MKLISTSFTGNFDIIEQGQVKASLTYFGLFSRSAEIKIGASTLKLTHKHLFSSIYTISKNNLEIGHLKFRLFGQIDIQLHYPGTSETQYHLKARGLFHRRFELFRKWNEPMMVMHPKTNWKKLRYDYELEWDDRFDDKVSRAELAALCGYGANLYKRAAASSGG